MIQLKQLNAELSSDINVKQAAAKKQMQELVCRLSDAPKYHKLTTQDRELLSNEGYASDLTNNLVVITQREKSMTSSVKDKLLVGFTYAAFDPALYGNTAIYNALELISNGCCCYCESFLMPVGAGEVGHFRPVSLLDVEISSESNSHTCSPYYLQAYEQSNLVYTCQACSTDHKAGRFPVMGERNAVDVNQEQPILVNPYHENPRDYIRFNPRNCLAYPFDEACAFYLAKHKQTAAEVEVQIWQDPSRIPNQFTSNGDLLTDSKIQQQYEDWRAQQQLGNSSTRGEQTIDIMGLNRNVLVLARLVMATSLMSSYEMINKVTSTKGEGSTPESLYPQCDTISYRSMAIDVLQTLKQASTNSPDITPDNKVNLTPTSLAMYKEDLRPSRAPKTIAAWLRSCLSYLVLESELKQTTKRRLVCLSAEDKIYGATDTEKCVFLPIDWKTDIHNVIKVKSHRNLWEASFLELAQSHPHELISLFANNDVWVEGDYTPLA
ncbi:hypothetical protein F0225_17850 [Vibrio pectenicida]|uniref:Uncharacterized protein n=1 Tax=Vibrio pectenicida TaxID=62763 RepID=A0A7Y4A1U7_9VIBR|nr:hypothetical protein [Vibrio pectenicida]NOH73185.1 hypothetical protein [Vibrio pectenicida]